MHSLPDPLVFAALVPKLTGARVILDLHECMPEFFATKFGVALDHRGVRVVAAAEQASIRFADFAITCTEQMREAFVGAGPTRRRSASCTTPPRRTSSTPSDIRRARATTAASR